MIKPEHIFIVGCDCNWCVRSRVIAVWVSIIVDVRAVMFMSIRFVLSHGGLYIVYRLCKKFVFGVWTLEERTGLDCPQYLTFGHDKR